MGAMSDALNLNELDLSREVVEHHSSLLREQIFAKYNEQFQPHEYKQVFYAPKSGEGRMDALFPEGFFGAAKLLLKGVASGELRQGIEGVAAIFLCRHWLELAIKYTLFHSRWLKDGDENAVAGDVKPVGKGHDLEALWGTLTKELGAKPSVVPQGLDLAFVGEFVREFNAVDKNNWRFRYPGEQLPVRAISHGPISVDFDALLFDLQRAYDILDTLDKYLVNTHGLNEETIQDGW